MSLLDTASLVVTPNGTKAGKLYSVVPSSGAGDLDVTRATTATRVNSSGLIESVASNVPRLDYTNGECPSILVEPQRTNLLTYSEQFDNVSWTNQNLTISTNSTTAPDGTSNADKLVITSVGTTSIFKEIASTSGTRYFLSVYVKKAETQYVNLGFIYSAGVYAGAQFDLNNGTVKRNNSSSYTDLSSSITSVVNGWYKLTVTCIINTATAYPCILPSNAEWTSGDIRQSLTGNNTTGAYFWGFQCEAGSYATSYIPTTSASVTRNADVISKTGISSLIGQTEGTVYWEGKANNFNGSNDVWLATISIDNTSTGLLIYHIFSTNQLAVFINNGSTNLQLFKTLNITQNNKIAVAYKSGQYALFVNGVLEDSSTNSMLPASSVNKFHLNEWNNSAKTCTTETKLSALWKTRLTNSQLAELTTI
jgi:hypothetical protein